MRLDEELGQFADNFVALVRGFGLLDGETTPCGVSVSKSSAHALCELAGGSHLPQSVLAERLRLTKSALSRLVDDLESRGWAQRVADPSGHDGRVRVVALTKAGDDMAKEILVARNGILARILDAVPKDGRETVVEALALLAEAARETS